MKTVLNIPKLGLVAALLALNLAPAQPARAAGAAPAGRGAAMTEAYARDLRTIMEANETLAHLQRALTLMEGRMAPLQQALMLPFRQDALPKELYQRAQPVYAAQLTPSMAATLALLMKQSPYRKRALHELKISGAVGYDSPIFTAAEAEELRLIDGSQVMASWRARLPGLDEAMGDMVKAWMDEFAAASAQRLLRNLRQTMEQVAALQDAEAVRELPMESTGVPAFDAVIRMAGENTLEMVRATQRVMRRLEPLDVAGLLQIQQLATAEGVAGSRQRLAQADALLEAYLKEMDGITQQREAGMRQLVLAQDPRFLQGMSVGISQLYAQMMEWGESLRRVYDQHRVALDFFAAQQGRYKMQDGLLRFDSDADAETANLLLANVRAAQAQAQQVGRNMVNADDEKLRKLGDSPGAGAR